ncbi:MAG: hypothetical protein O3A01_03065 [bacterium]|nr:hypothetical protein [bacterium]
MPKLPFKHDKSHYPEYHALLCRIHSDLETIAYELESHTVNQPSGTVDPDIVFDAIPILRKLKTALEATAQSKSFFKTK